MDSLADLHMHTTASDGVLSPQALVNEVLIRQLAMRGPRLRVIAITDHDTLEGAWTARHYLESHHAEADLEIICGSEISSADGHIVALDIREDIPMDMPAAATIEAIHAQGGLAIAAHPYAWLPFLKELKGIGGLIADPAVGPFLDGVEVRNSNPTEIFNNYYSQWVNRRGYRRPEVGASDSHFRSAVAHATTRFPGRTADDLRRALREGTTRAVGAVYGPWSVLEYFRERLEWERFCKNDPIRSVS